MAKFYDVLESIYEAENLRHKGEMVRRTVQNCYYEICRRALWIDLVKEVSLDFSTAADSTGLWLPSNLSCPDIIVRDETTEASPVVYLPRNEGRRNEYAEYRYTWFYTEVLQQPRWTARDLSIAQRGTSFTVSAAPGDPAYTTLVGEYAMFGMEPGIYEITEENDAFTEFTISPVYNGPTIERGADDAHTTWRIRPAKTRKLSVQESGAFDSDATVKVYYAAYPTPLYELDQEIMLPSEMPLINYALSLLAGSGQARSGYAAAWQEGLAEMKKMNPDFTAFSAPKDVTDSYFKFRPEQRSFYSER